MPPSRPSAPRPPRLARWLLRALLPRDIGDSFAGDLEERFRRRADVDPGGARRAYWRDVLSPTVLRLRREVKGMHRPGAPTPDPSEETA